MNKLKNYRSAVVSGRNDAQHMLVLLHQLHVAEEESVLGATQRRQALEHLQRAVGRLLCLERCVALQITYMYET